MIDAKANKEATVTNADIAKFEKACKMLAELGEKGLYLYLAEDCMNLMSGPSHDDDYPFKARQDRVKAQVYIPKSGGGDW